MNKLKFLLHNLFFFIAVSSAFSQILDPVMWTYEINQVEGDEYELVFTGDIEPGWSVYSQYLESEDGPIATSLNFEMGAHFELLGKSTEDEAHRKEGFDAIFEMNLTKYSTQMLIRQRVKYSDPAVPIKGFLTFMTCDDTQCLPPADVDFTFMTKGNKVEQVPVEEMTESETINVVDLEELYGIPLIDTDNVAGDCEIESVRVEKNQGFWTIFVLGMLGGLLALLTPCVFPMIPLTVSFFTKSNEKKNGARDAVLYGFFILLVYVLLSIPFHLLDQMNPDILNDISTNVWLNISFFVIFIVFAISFFGYFEITLPHSWSNKVSSAEGIGGIVGIFFMALTLALVSFSCTGPILGSLLAGALTADGGAWQLTAGMSGFGLALALPFALFAMFPNWMNKIPRSGSWLVTIKVILGFLELALALKFLSNADLVMHWGILKIEVFYGLWILIFFALALYLWGKIKFSSADNVENISMTRKFLAFVSIAIVAYLATGFNYDESRKTYKPLTALSGLAPPAGYSWMHPSKCPNNIECFNDLKTGLEYAKEQNKPVMLDFTGYACVNCRKMEEHVWPEEGILDKLQNDYVLISLYVDDKKELPEDQQVEVQRINGGVRTLTNYGHKWAHFQTAYFGVNSQPYYVLLSPDGSKMLNNPANYTPDAEEFAAFLDCGLESYEKLNAFGSGNIVTE